jgi:protein-disulfide isomerase
MPSEILLKALDRVLNIALVVAAVAMAGVMVRREIIGASKPARGSPSAYRNDWPTFTKEGRLVAGSTRSPVQIVEFLDLACPACRLYQPGTLATIRQRYGDSVAITVIHYPLPMHRFAVPAAHASECAAKQGRFSSFVDVALAKQDSFGLKPWPEYAAEAGVGDSTAYSRCLAQGSSSLVDDGVTLAARLGVKGTPTILVNGWEFSSPPGEQALRDEIDAILAGKPRRP